MPWRRRILHVAAHLIEQIGIALFAQTNIQHSLNRWLSRLPAAIIHERPRLCLIYAWSHVCPLGLFAGFQRVAEAETALQRSHRGLPMRQIAGEIAAIRAMQTAYKPSMAPSEAIAWGQQALATLSADQATFRCIAALWLGHGLHEARRYARWQHNPWPRPTAWVAPPAISTCSSLPPRIRPSCNARWAQCVSPWRLGQEALVWVTQRDALAYPIVGSLYLNLADLLREQNELSVAEHYAQEAVAHSDQEVYPAAMSILSRLVLMRIKQARAIGRRYGR